MPEVEDPEVEIEEQLDGPDIQAVSALQRAAGRAGGHRLLTADGAHRGLLAREPGRRGLVGFAQVSRDTQRWSVELVVDPRAVSHSSAWASLLVASVDVVSRDGGGPVRVWVHDATAEHDALAEAAGLGADRDLYQMRRRLPADEPSTLPTRAFVVGRDEQSWLDVNNRAFADHPDQGGWTLDHLRRLEAEPWFDPEGFLLHERAGRLAGFCWTKVHDDEEPAMGELYVVGVDPDLQGQGLGRHLVVAGLAWLSGKGLAWAMLYVDGSNQGAVRLYESLGFAVHHVDRAYVGVVPPIKDPST